VLAGHDAVRLYATTGGATQGAGGVVQGGTFTSNSGGHRGAGAGWRQRVLELRQVCRHSRDRGAKHDHHRARRSARRISPLRQRLGPGGRNDRHPPTWCCLGDPIFAVAVNTGTVLTAGTLGLFSLEGISKTQAR